MNAKQKRIISILLALVLVFSLLPAMYLTAGADYDNIAYVNAAGEDMGTQPCTHVNTNTTTW